jgi:hypothetical protein
MSMHVVIFFLDGVVLRRLVHWMFDEGDALRGKVDAAHVQHVPVLRQVVCAVLVFHRLVPLDSLSLSLSLICTELNRWPSLAGNSLSGARGHRTSTGEGLGMTHHPSSTSPPDLDSSHGVATWIPDCFPNQYGTPATSVRIGMA